MDSRIDGRQNPEYAGEYYRKNKERITKRNKEHYQKMRSTPEALALHRKRSAEATARWRARHPDKFKDGRKQAYINRKLKAMGLLGGAVCVSCGCDELDYLEFNHINGGGAKEYRESKRKGMMDRLLTEKRRRDDMNVLCRVCNALDHLKRKSPTKIGRYSIKWEKLTGSKAVLQ